MENLHKGKVTIIFKTNWVGKHILLKEVTLKFCHIRIELTKENSRPFVNCITAWSHVYFFYYYTDHNDKMYA